MKKIIVLIAGVLPIFAFASSSISSNILTLDGVSGVGYPSPYSSIIPAQLGTNLSIATTNYAANITTPTSNQISFSAQRELSAVPVNQAETWLAAESISWENSNIAANHQSGNALPTQLNFLLKGDLGFIYNNATYICPNVMVGQGQKGNSDYPWWMFTNTNYTFQSNQLKSGNVIIQCVNQSTGENDYFYFNPTSDGTFKINGQVNLSAPPMLPQPQGEANQVCFDNIESASFSNPFVYATPGQTYEESMVTVKKNCLTVYANRDNTTTVANLAESELSAGGISWNGNNMTTYADDDSGTPKALSFFAKGNLEFIYNKQTYICSNVMFGQGKDSSNPANEHNWWAFSNIDYAEVSSYYAEFGAPGGEIFISCTDQDNTTTFLLLKRSFTSDNTFSVEDTPKTMHSGPVAV